MSETALVKACLEYLRLIGCYVWRNNTGMLYNKVGRPVAFGKVGSSDILGILPGGRFLAVECKIGRNPLSRSQQTFLDEVGRTGGLAIVVRDSVDSLVDRLGPRRRESEDE